MLLTIRTLSCPPPDDPRSLHAEFDREGGRIGRSAPCKLILPDPNRHISREHAEIRWRDTAFSIKVVSKVNSVLVNDAVLNPGEAVALNDGDRVLIGEYLLSAEINQVAAAPAGYSTAPAPAGDPFALFDSLAARAVPAPAPPPDWFQSAPPPPPRQPADPQGASVDSLFQPDDDPGRFGDLIQDASPRAPANAPSTQPAAQPDRRIDAFLGLDDPLAGLDSPTDPLRRDPASTGLYHGSPLDRALGPAQPGRPDPAPAPTPPASSTPPAAPPFDDDIFKVLEREFGAPASDPALSTSPAAPPPPVAVPLTPPPRPEAAPAPPPAFGQAPHELPDFGDLLAPPPPAQPALPAGTAGPTPELPDFGDLLGTSAAPTDPTPTAPRPARAAPLHEPAQRGAHPERPASPIAPPSAPVTAPVAPPVLASGGDAASSRRLMAALAESLGLAPEELDQSNPEQTIRLVGELLRMSTDGLFRMLEMRSQLKSELHIEDRTMIASRENNPLKHADSAHDAIAYLVDLRQHGNRLFMPPIKAVEDTVWDICAHEMAVMAGTRAALLASLKMFSPEVVEGRIKKTGALENVLPALHKSRLWERFLGMYAELQHEAEDHFDRLLNQEFSKAYSEQSRKLKKKR